MEPTSVVMSEPGTELPDHTQLPDKDDSIVTNFSENPQGNLLTSSMLPRFRELHPDGQYCIGHDSGIYWRYTQPVLDGCKAPDWFYVPGVPPMLEGHFRRSYVLWREAIRPLLVIEFVSGDGSEERDTTPYQGKFWIYERAICAAYYAIYDVEKATVELFKLNGGGYHPVEANAAGRLPIEPLGVELGIWQGMYREMGLPWMRVWDSATGELLPTEEERAEMERKRAETAESLLDDMRQMLDEECERAEDETKRADNERRRAEDQQKRAEEEHKRAEDQQKRAEDQQKRAEDERKRAEKLAERLRAAGIDPDTP